MTSSGDHWALDGNPRPVDPASPDGCSGRWTWELRRRDGRRTRLITRLKQLPAETLTEAKGRG